ncbi:MAG TPA: homocysteine S-methyltransferase family protein [Casimicrobiaceae bacterium]|nr:homocysteine S-methyltransferase family protein [Casimicrobiaceae bacterium]
MSPYRRSLPQLADRNFITDGGLETTLIYHDGIELPYFAAFVLLDRPGGEPILHRYFSRYAEIARAERVGVVLESATWRANPDWAAKLGYAPDALADIQRRAIAQLLDVRERYQTPETPIVVSGNLGPRGDGYRAEQRMSADEAEDYHGPQVRTFAATPADMVAAFTMNYTDEAIGIARAAKASDMPVAISFTVETDGRLPSGESLQQAIDRVDEATGAHPAYYMINCAHPSHFANVLDASGGWQSRLRGLRANASKRSHAELDAATELDVGDPLELARDYVNLKRTLPKLTIVGGCCGTDHRHIEAVCRATVVRQASLA